MNPPDNPHVDIAGPQDAPAMVLLHGGAFNRKMWLPQMSALSDTFRLIAPDLPGHGARGNESFSFASAVDTVSEVIGKEANGAAIVVGLSLGGYTAMAHAERHPEQVRGMVLSGCSVNYRGFLQTAARLNALVIKLLSQERFENAQAKRLHANYSADVVQAILAEGVYKHSAAQVLLEVARTDFHAKLASYAGPVLILNAENDALNRSSETDAVAAAQRARLEIIENAGHVCNLDQPAIFSERISNFAVTL